MTCSEWINLGTLIVVAVYTFFTYRLFSQQRDQFALGSRPWVTPEDIHFDKDPVQPKLTIPLFNFGRLPASCVVRVSQIVLTPFEAQSATLLPEDSPTEIPVFPNIQGMSTISRFVAPLKPDQRRLLIDGCQIQIDIQISYRSLTQKSSSFPYHYAAKMTVQHFQESATNQITQITDAIIS
jgi:hypothetical protein